MNQLILISFLYLLNKQVLLVLMISMSYYLLEVHLSEKRICNYIYMVGESYAFFFLLIISNQRTPEVAS